jgi:hypothetical protein
VGGAVAELVIAQVMERRAGVGGAYEAGAARTLKRAATALTAAGAGLMAVRDRRAAVAGGALISAGALAERWSVFRAGFQSAARPQDTVEPQRSRIRAGLARGAARAAPRRPPPAASEDGHRPGERPVPPGSPAIQVYSSE